MKVLIDPKLPQGLRQRLINYLVQEGHEVVKGGEHDVFVTCPEGITQEKSLRVDILCLTNDLSREEQDQLRENGADFVRSPTNSAPAIFQGVL